MRELFDSSFSPSKGERPVARYSVLFAEGARNLQKREEV
jgi:hypothetical protein